MVEFVRPYEWPIFSGFPVVTWCAYGLPQAPAFVGVIGDEADMPNKLADLEAQLFDLNKERAELDMAIEEMMADMAALPTERRSASDWASDGALTKQFLDMTNRQAELEAEIVTVSRAITAAKKPVLPH
jgi:hypothetical protein